MSLHRSPVHQIAEQYPQQLAIIEPQLESNRQLSYAQFSQLICQVADQLAAQQLQAGDRLAVISHNNLSMIVLYWACVELGVIYFPINPKFPSSQILELIEYYQINYHWQQLDIALNTTIKGKEITSQAIDIDIDINVEALTLDRLALSQPINLDPNAFSNVILTSGSTGFPKAAVHQLSQHLANAQGAASCIPLTANDRWLLSLPLFHIGGLAILHRCALVGATVVISQQQELAQQLQIQQITHVSLVATQLQRLLDQAPESLSSVKSLLLGGGAIAPSLIERLKPFNIPAYTSYGMTEMGSQICTGLATTDNTSGKLLPYREMEIRDQVIWVRGKTLFSGYLSTTGIDPCVDAQGWFCTKDRGFFDAQGYLHLLGRSDNMFVCGGENIQPEEIENILKVEDEISEAICFAIDDREFTHLPAVVIKLSDLGRSKLSTGELQQQALHPNSPLWLSFEHLICSKIARFKRPRHYFLWPENLSQAGLKIDRKQVIAQVKIINDHQ